MKNCYLVNNAKHGTHLIAYAESADVAYIYQFERYYNEYDPTKVVTREQLLDCSTEYDINTIYIHEGSAYRLFGSKALARNHGTLTAGQTIIVGVMHDHTCEYMVDSEKYPLYDISDWRYCKNATIRPLMKFYVHDNDESILDFDRVYYHHSRNNDTIFITNDNVPSTVVLDESIKFEPEEVKVKRVESGNIEITVVYNRNNKKLAPSGILHLANTAGIATTAIPLVNGLAIIPNEYIFGEPFADILLGYHKIGTL